MNEQVKINPPTKDDSKLLAMFSLIMGIISIPTAFIVFGMLVGIIGIIFGVWHWMKRTPGRIMSGIGIGISCVGIAASICMLSLYIWMIGEMQLNFENSNKSYDQWIGVQTPDMEFTTLDGKEMTLAELKGKRVVLDFWATWCPPCKKEIPHFIKLQNEHPNDIVVVGISHEDNETQQKFADEYGINFILAKSKTLPEPFDSVRSIPTTFYIDRNGVIQQYSVGYHGYSDIESNAIQDDFAGEVLSEPKPEEPESQKA